MLNDVKSALISNPDHIVTMLDHFGFSRISLINKEIRCARQEGSNATSICIRLQNNEKLYAKDYARDNSGDLFALIINEKLVSFREVVAYARELTGTGFDQYEEDEPLFGGFIDTLYSEDEDDRDNVIRQEKELHRFKKIFSYSFLKDYIPLTAQNIFDIRYDLESNRIVIPIRDSEGRLIGAKGRLNYDSDIEPKYLYLLPCIPSLTLFGYQINYSSMCNNDVLICESEKAVMQAYGYSYHNALGIAGNNISSTQLDLIADLLPKRVILALDKSLDIRQVQKNIDNLKSSLEILGTEIWQWVPDSNIPEKSCITDMGENVFYRELKRSIKRV